MPTAAAAPASPAAVPSWPTVASGRSRSPAICGRTGDSVRNAAWDAKRHAKRIGAGRISVHRGRAAQGDLAEELVGAVRAERVHEGAGADVAVRRASGCVVL